MQRCYGCMKEYGKEYDVCPHCGYIVGTKPESKSHLQFGTKLADRYTVGKALGWGGFGITYIAWDDKLQKAVAVKEYFPNAFSTRSEGDTQVSCFSSESERFLKDGIRKMLDEDKIKNDFIFLENGYSRINVKLKTDEETEINGQGPEISEKFLNELYKKFAYIK